jgi:hemoglobin-like flavoprotein
MIRLTVEMMEDEGRSYIEIERPLQETDMPELLQIFREAALGLSYQEQTWDNAVLAMADDIKHDKFQRGQLPSASSKGEL